ncbi:pyridoxal kinase PdxY [soil metagenome]
MSPQPGVVSVTSRVSNGAVGNSLIEAAFSRLAPHIPLATVDTVQWTAPGNHPRANGPIITGRELFDMLRMLLDPPGQNGGGGRHLMTGYFRTAEQVAAVSAAIEESPPLLSLTIDPILGDNGNLYVEESTAEAIRDLILPRATYVLPNITEASYLTSGSAVLSTPLIAFLSDLNNSMKRLGMDALKAVILKSVPYSEKGVPEENGPRLGVRVIGAKCPDFHGQRLAEHFAGAGDLFCGAFVAALLSESEPDVVSAAEVAQRETMRAIERLHVKRAIGLREAFLQETKQLTSS